LSQIISDTDAFQNREENCSPESVDKIKQAVYDGTFNWEEFDPILLWKSDDNKLYVLAGHSRVQAFRELTTEGYNGFYKIPSKIINDKTKTEAQEIAKRSNVLSSKETNSERADYYRIKREGGATKSEISKEAKLYEGSNAVRIKALSYLIRDGKTLMALKAFEKSGNVDCTENIAKIAKWIGEARQSLAILMDAHENELYDWLTNEKIFEKICTEREFLARIRKLIEKPDFNPQNPLNLFAKSTETHYDIEYKQQVANKNQAIAEQKNAINKKTEQYNNERKPPAQIVELLKNDNIILHKLEQDLVAIEQKNEFVNDANKGLLELFDNVSSAFAEREIIAEFNL